MFESTSAVADTQIKFNVLIRNRFFFNLKSHSYFKFEIHVRHFKAMSLKSYTKLANDRGIIGSYWLFVWVWDYWEVSAPTVLWK